jgi:hypothetical protein
MKNQNILLKKYRGVALFLSFILLFGMIPVISYADDITISVGSEEDFIKALKNSQVGTIILTKDIALKDNYTNTENKCYQTCRNVTIKSENSTDRKTLTLGNANLFNAKALTLTLKDLKIISGNYCVRSSGTLNIYNTDIKSNETTNEKNTTIATLADADNSSITNIYSGEIDYINITKKELNILPQGDVKINHIKLRKSTNTYTRSFNIKPQDGYTIQSISMKNTSKEDILGLSSTESYSVKTSTTDDIDFYDLSVTVLDPSSTELTEPTFSPESGSIEYGTSLQLTASGGDIYYTDGTTAPSSSSTKYTDVIPITSEMTISAVTIASDGTNSEVVTKSYTPYVAAPVFTPETGEIFETDSGNKVSISSTTTAKGAKLYYTTDGSDPVIAEDDDGNFNVVTNGTEYTGPIDISENTTVKAIAAAGKFKSSVETAVYRIKCPADAPKFSLETGTVMMNSSLEIVSGTENAVIYYTTDGTDPNVEDVVKNNEKGSTQVYSSPIVIDDDITVKAVAIAENYFNSEISVAEYKLQDRNKLNVVAAEHGSVDCQINQKSVSDAPVGKTVQINVSPDSGYILESLSVTDAGGKAVVLNKSSDAVYSFTMPASDLTVSAVFAEAKKVLEINNASDLKNFAASVNTGMDYSGETVNLNEDIDLQGVWTPIGTNQNPFRGVFKGNSHTIHNMIIKDSDEKYQGLFGYIDNASVSGVTVEGSISCFTDYNGDTTVYIGGIAGYVKKGDESELKDCVSKVDIDLGVHAYVGGLFGSVSGSGKSVSISNCTNWGDINVNLSGILGASVIDVGGIAGYVQTSTVDTAGNASQLLNYGDISFSGGYRIAYPDGDMQGLYPYRQIHASGGFGGLIGESVNTNIKSSANKGNIKGDVRYAGGLVGNAGGVVFDSSHKSVSKGTVITDSYNTGDIECTLDENNYKDRIRLAGLVGTCGYCRYDLTLTNCYNTGQISAARIATNVNNQAWCDEIQCNELDRRTGTEYNNTITVTNCYSFSAKTSFPDGTSYGYDGLHKIKDGETQLLTVAALNGSESSAWKSDSQSINGGYPLLEWESEKASDEKYTVSFNLESSVKNATIKVFKGDEEIGTGNSYSLSSGLYTYEIVADGYKTVSKTFNVKVKPVNIDVTLTPVRNVTFAITPDNANLTVVNTSGGSAENYISNENGVYTYELVLGDRYEYTVTCSGYVSKVDTYSVPEAGGKININLESIGGSSGSVDSLKYVRGGSVIKEEGTYYVESGATGVITVDTTAAVKIAGTGISSSDKFSDLTIKGAVSGVNLTIENLYIQNNVGKGTSAGAAGSGVNTIDFKGKGNTLNFSGVNLLEGMEYVEQSGIHVPKGAELTIGENSSGGTLYMYKYSQGSGIGGDTDESCGDITFAGGNIFIKGSKTGALIGGDATNGTTNGKITISGGNINLVNKAKGAAIGSSASGSCAGAVSITGGNVTIISDFDGSAIGYGGNKVGSPGTLSITGGSLKCVRTANSTTGSWNSGEQSVDDSLITADMGNLKRLVFDAKGTGVSVDGYDGTVYAGHEYYYTESNTSTVSNWSYSSDSHVYLYLDNTKSYKLTGAGSTYNVAWSETEGEFLLTDTKTGTTVSGGVGNPTVQTPAVVETPIQQTEVTTETKVDGNTATVKADDKSLTEAAKEADKNTQFVIKGDMGDADVSKVSTEVGKDTLKAVAEAQASIKVETPVANITLPNEALKDIAAQSGATVSVTAELKEDGSTTINLSVDSKSMTKLSGGIKAAIPVILDKISKGINRTTISDSKVPLGETPDSTESTDDTSTDSAENTTDSAVSVDMNGLVAVLVSDDGTESIIPKSVIENGTVYVLLDGSATVKVADNSKTFTDVADTWYTDAVGFAAGHELFNGVSDSEFAPLNKMSRAMLVTVLHRLEGTPSASNSTSFSDVESGKWYTDAISWANANDIVNGLGDGLFGTNNNITREQMATILYRYMKEQGLSVSASGDISSFPDGDSVSSYAEEAMSWAIGSGIITGKDSAEGTLLDPKGNASRAEVATMLKRMIGIMVK